MSLPSKHKMGRGGLNCIDAFFWVFGLDVELILETLLGAWLLFLLDCTACEYDGLGLFFLSCFFALKTYQTS